MNKSKISVIMGIYNCADTLGEAIDSIISQTYTNWELIMCDDGSSDNTYDVAKRYVEKYPTRMKLLRHTQNMGLNKTLNDCLKEATGTFIGRMDGDDISLPKRFEREMKAFEEEPELAVVSCPMIYFDEDGEWGRGKEGEKLYPQKRQLARGTVHCHAPAIIRKSVMDTVGGYTEDKMFLRVEDWNLWTKIYAAGFYGLNLEECLYMMRDDHKALKRKNYKTCIREAKMTVFAVKTLHLQKWNCVYALRPLIVGALPKGIYNWMHRLKMRSV